MRNVPPWLISALGYAVYLLGLGTLMTLPRYPGQRWGWLALLALIGVFALLVHLFSSRLLWLLDTQFRVLSGQPIPSEVGETVDRLRGLGFGIPVWWEARGAAVGLARSTDGLTTAWVDATRVKDGPIFGTAWDGASLTTARVSSVPLEPNDYVQHLGGADIEDMVATHEEAIRILSRVYGPPIHSVEHNLEATNRQGIERRDYLRKRRYRQSTKVILTSSFGGGYRITVPQRLSLTATPWKVGVTIGAAIVLWSVAIFAWVWYFTDEIESWTLPLAMTLLFGTISFIDFQRMNRWRRFI